MTFVQPNTTTEISFVDFIREADSIMNRSYNDGERFIVRRDDQTMVKIEPVLSEKANRQAEKELAAFVKDVRDELSTHESSEVDAAFDEAVAFARKHP